MLEHKMVKENENNFKNLFNTIESFIFVIDINTNILFANQCAISKIGHSLEEFLKLNIFDLHPKRYLADAKKLFSMIVQGKLTTCPLPILSKEGKELDVEVQITEGVWNEEKAFFAVGKDISQSKIMEKELVKQRMFLQSLIDTIPDSILYKDLNGVYLECNEAFLRRYSFKNKRAIIGKTDYEIDRDRSLADIFVRQDEEVLSTQETKIYENEIILANGEISYIETKKSPFYDEQGNLSGVIGVSRDITRRKKAEQSLKETEERFNQIANSINDVFWIGTDEKVEYVSPAFEKIWGRNRDEFYKDNKAFYKYIHKEDLDRMHNILSVGQEVYLQKGIFNEEYRIIRPDGSIRWIWAKRFPIKNSSGKIIRKVGIGKDITELKIAQEELIKAKEEIFKKELEKQSLLLNQTLELEKLRTEFFSNLSHELRTPLNIIIGALQLLECNNTISEDNRDKYLKIIKQNGYRLLRLINNLIDSTKIDAGFMTFNAQNLNIISLVEDITLSVVEYANLKGINIVFDTEMEEKTICCDPDKMERIMLNILSNAIKFCTSGDSIYVNISKKQKYLTISIKDTGIGIPADKIDMLFLRFRQVDNLLTRRCEGSGIGLSLVKSFVEMHGGEVTVSSTFGKETEFLIKLPDRVIEKDYELPEYIMDEEKLVEKIKIEFSDIYF